ncbi:MAG: hypothetical protein WB573_02020, partial [Terracidiphilus sp.]
HLYSIAYRGFDLLKADFESAASASSAIPALGWGSAFKVSHSCHSAAMPLRSKRRRFTSLSCASLHETTHTGLS